MIKFLTRNIKKKRVKLQFNYSFTALTYLCHEQKLKFSEFFFHFVIFDFLYYSYFFRIFIKCQYEQQQQGYEYYYGEQNGNVTGEAPKGILKKDRKILLVNRQIFS